MSPLNSRQLRRRYGDEVANVVKFFGIAKAKKGGKHYLLLYRPVEGKERSNLTDVFEVNVTEKHEIDDKASGIDLLLALMATNDLPTYWRVYKVARLMDQLEKCRQAVDTANVQTKELLDKSDFPLLNLPYEILMAAFGNDEQVMSFERRVIDHGFEIKFEAFERFPDPGNEAKAKAEAVLQSARKWLDPLLRTILEHHKYPDFRLTTLIIWDPFSITIQGLSFGSGLYEHANYALNQWREHMVAYNPAELAEIDGRRENKLTLRRRVERWLGI